jgi:hypothetical protein
MIVAGFTSAVAEARYDFSFFPNSPILIPPIMFSSCFTMLFYESFLFRISILLVFCGVLLSFGFQSLAQ